MHANTTVTFLQLILVIDKKYFQKPFLLKKRKLFGKKRTYLVANSAEEKLMVAVQLSRSTFDTFPPQLEASLLRRTETLALLHLDGKLHTVMSVVLPSAVFFYGLK